jgi:DNA-binding NarL/FixJ family response regulator
VPFQYERIMSSSAFAHLRDDVVRGIEAGRIEGEPMLVSVYLWSVVHGITSLLISKPNFPWPDVDVLIDNVARSALFGVVPRLARRGGRPQLESRAAGPVVHSATSLASQERLGGPDGTGGRMPGETGSIRLMLCDDHRILTDALAEILETESAFELIAPPVATGEEAIELASRHAPDLVLMDVGLEGPIDGIEATRRIREASPETKVLIMSGRPEEQYLVEAVEAGACGFITKGENVEDVMDKMKAAAEGEMLVEPGKLSRLLRAAAAARAAQTESESLRARLTTRELEVLELIAGGLRNDEIARQLTISPHTAHSHVRAIQSKLGVRSKLEAVTLAAKHGIVSL